VEFSDVVAHWPLDELHLWVPTTAETWISKFGCTCPSWSFRIYVHEKEHSRVLAFLVLQHQS
jgi:hypothetical protein